MVDMYHVDRPFKIAFSLLVLYLLFFFSYFLLYTLPSMRNRQNTIREFESRFPVPVVETDSTYRYYNIINEPVGFSQFTNSDHFFNQLSQYTIIRVIQVKTTGGRVEYIVTAKKKEYPQSTSTYTIMCQYQLQLIELNDGFFKVKEYEIR